MQEVRETGRQDASSAADLPALRSGIMIALRHELGRSALLSERLKIAKSSSSALSGRFLRKLGGMSSAPHASFPFCRLIAEHNSTIVIGLLAADWSLVSACGLSSLRLNERLKSRSSLLIFSLDTLA